MGMTYEEVFSQVKKIFMEADVSGEKEHLAFQFNIAGEGEGAQIPFCQSAVGNHQNPEIFFFHMFHLLSLCLCRTCTVFLKNPAARLK